MFTQMRFNLKFLGAILFAVTFLVGGFFVANTAKAVYTEADFVAFDGVDIATNSYTLSTGVTATYNTGTGTVGDPVKLTLTGYAPIITPWFGTSWTTFNYVTIGIKLPTGFSGTPSVYRTGIMRYDDPIGYKMSTIGDGTTPLATAGGALNYLDFSFAANSNNTKKDGLVKLQVIWNVGDAPEYFIIDITDLQLDTPTHKFISTLDQLKTALADTNVTTIDITKDISGITEELIVDHAVIINGGSHTLTFTSALNTLAGGHRDGIFVMANGTTINDLSVVMAGAVGWQGVYGIQFYGVTGGVANNYTGTGADAALLVNGSAVTLTGTTTVSGNEFGGIEVSKGTPLNASALTVTGTLVNSTEAYGKPTIWLVNGQGTVTGGPATTRTSIKTDQTQYYLTAGNAFAAHTLADFAVFDGVAVGTNSYTVSTGITATYPESNTIKLTGYAPIVTPWFMPTWTTFNYVTIGIKLPAGFSGNTTVSSTGVMKYYDSFNNPVTGYYDMGSGSTPLATTGAALSYLDFSFGANKNYVKDGLVKLEVIWNVGDAPEYFTIDVSDLQLVDPAITLAAAKTAAHLVLTNALATYTSTNYTAENWTALNKFKIDGDTAIDAAGTTDAVTSAQTTATTGMSGVAIIPQHHSSGGRSATPAVPAKVETPDGCVAGNKFSTTTGRNCNAATPAVPAGQVLGASTQVGQVLGAEKFKFTLFIKNGSNGSEIIELQKFLSTLGYTLVADGKFGPKTKGAVIKFQIANGLKGDGIVGPLTRAVLNK